VIAVLPSFHLPAAVLGFMGMHLSIRTEARAIVDAAAAGDLVRAERRARLLGRVVRHHHAAEDNLLFPLLAERRPGFDATTDELERQHADLDRLVRLVPSQLGLAAELGEMMEAHLQAEEEHVLPVWLATFSEQEHEQFERMLRRSTPMSDVALLVSWLLDTSPSAARDVAAVNIPAPFRFVHRVWWRRTYERDWGTVAAAA
jgi:hypothetical protein